MKLRRWIAVVTMLLLAGVVCQAATTARDRFAREAGLDVDLVNFVTVDVGGDTLTLTVVFVNERTFQSRISSRLAGLLKPFVGQNALYVNASVESVVSGLPFDPTRLLVQQDDKTWAASATLWSEITHGFLAGRSEVNPMGATRGSGSEGILLLGERIDPSRPFYLRYAEEELMMQISTSSPDPIFGPKTPDESVDVIYAWTPESWIERLLGDAFSADELAAALDIDPAFVRAEVIPFRGDEQLRLLLIRLDDGLLESALGSALLDTLRDLIGTGAIMVWAVSPTGAPFSAWNLYVQQRGTRYTFYSTASFLELTPGFLRRDRVDQGELVAGVLRWERIRLGGFDPEVAYTLFYAGTPVEFP